MLFRIILKDESSNFIDERMDRTKKRISFVNKIKIEAKIKTVIEIYEEEDFLKAVKFICKKEPFSIDNILISNGSYENVLSRILPNNYNHRLIIVAQNEDEVHSDYDKGYNKYAICFNKEFFKVFEQEIYDLNIKIIKNPAEGDIILKLNKYKEIEWNFYQKIKTYSKDRKIAFFDEQKCVWYFNDLE